VNTAAPTFGIGARAIITGMLVQYAPHPTRFVFAALMALFVALAFATVLLPETVPRVPDAVAGCARRSQFRRRRGGRLRAPCPRWCPAGR
jgi:hypothetical protein